MSKEYNLSIVFQSPKVVQIGLDLDPFESEKLQHFTSSLPQSITSIILVRQRNKYALFSCLLCDRLGSKKYLGCLMSVG